MLNGLLVRRRPFFYDSPGGEHRCQREARSVKPNPRYRWFVVFVFFLFMLLHQTDRLMIGPMQETIEQQFSIDDRQWGFINTGALLVGTLLYPLWGYLYDRYARPRL